MSGLVWSALGQGISSLGNTMGSIMARESDREDRQEEQRRRDEERRAYEKERDALRLANKTSGDPQLDISEGGKDEGMLARSAGMTVPELRALRRYSETGNTEPFKRDVTKEVDVPNPENPDYDSTREQRTVKELPPGFEAEAKAKAQALSKIEESYRMLGKYDDVTKGRINQQQVDKTEEAIRNPDRAGVINRGMISGKGGKLFENAGESGTFDVSTGSSTLNKLGESKVTENNAQAGQAAAAGRLSDAKAEATRNGEDPENVNSKTADLQRKIGSAKARLARELGVAENEINAALVSLSKNKSPDAQARLEKVKPFVDRLDEAQAAMDNWRPGKTKSKEPAAAPAPAPAAGKSTTQRRGTFNPKTGQIEWNN